METIRNERLARWGEQVARSIPITGTIPTRKVAHALSSAMHHISEMSRQEDVSAWYADNGYLVRREGELALRAFHTVRRLRRCPDGAVLIVLCRRFVGAGPLTEERIEGFLTGASRTEAIPETEAVLIGPALRMAIIQELAEEPRSEKIPELFTSLRDLAELDLTDALERSDPVDTLLREDSVYPRMDDRTRADYRQQIQKKAKRAGCSALEMAQTALDAGLHDYLFPDIQRKGGAYIAAHALLTCALTVLAAWLSRTPWTFLAAVLPISDLVSSLMDSTLLRFVKPRRLHRLELKEGLGTAGRTICAVSILLSDDDVGPELCGRLEEYRAANRDCGKDLLFAILADLPDSKIYPAPGGQARLDETRAIIEDLDRRYGGGFFLLTRDLTWNRADQIYAPWERKRGAILELCRLAQGKPSALRCLAGDRKELRARYILCLDGDTRLVPGSARALVGVALHPVNQPIVKDGVVIKGHGAIHPRMSVELEHALATDFSRLYAGQGGTDPYSAPTGELFSDLFGRGGFFGKGILDAEAYLACMEDRFPEDTVLSHDALEGAYLRGAYLGDKELTDSAPVNATSWFRRLHRWTRGDWQNLPWLFRRGRDLTAIDRWRLFDNVRRSLVGAAALVSLCLSFFLPSMVFAAGTALFCLGIDAIRDAFAGLFTRTQDARFRSYSGVLRGVGGSFTRFLVRLIFLPWESFTCLSAMVTALWRMGLSHRHMLQWVPAAQSERSHALPAAAWASVLLGIALLITAPGPAGKAVGVIWLFAPCFSWATGLRQHPKNDLSDGDRELLLKSARAIWRYFSDMCTPEDHWLPPDNLQIQPPKGIARRTSPTNIGLAMASAIAAMELEIATVSEAVALIEHIMTAIEQMPRWRGHLYNWYDTVTGAPLQPAYVSTVDSGNLCACLMMVSHGLTAHGQEDLARRAMTFAEEIDLAALYDEKRRLFRIGLDPASDTVSPGHYDLMASEARLTSFIACARGEVPVRHWAALSRAQLSLDGWRGLASWSGSMFEYLMPELFLPLVRGSMLWETGRFCLYAQRRHAAVQKAPFGNSESAFFSLDAAMDYRYKAHGTGALALRRDMNSELVIAPYASFLALCVHPKAAVKNLRRLKGYGMWGRYGFYEALDLTPGRTGRDGAVVACFMSHHMGMSLCAIANSLQEGILRQYFMADPACRAFQPLLAERVPLSGPILRRDRSPVIRPPEARQENPAFLWEGIGYDPSFPVALPLSNGVYSLLCGADGTCTAQAHGLLMYRPGGLELRVDGQLITSSLRNATFLPWCYASGTVTFHVAEGNDVMTCSLATASGECGELRRITGPDLGKVQIRFEPVLAKKEDHEAHPAFWRLGLEVTSKEETVCVRRLSRGDIPEMWLCLAGTMPLTIRAGSGFQMNDPVIIEGSLPEGGCGALALCFGMSRGESMAGARRILAGGTADMAGSMASLLGMAQSGIAAAFALCADILSGRIRNDGSPEDASREALWKEGISGDLPILWVSATEDLDVAKRMVKRHALLTACGVRSDLVIQTQEEGVYLKPRTEQLRRYLDKYGLSSFEGARGGVHFCQSSAAATAAVRYRKKAEPGKPDLPGLRPATERGRKAPELSYLNGGAVCFQTPPLPPRAWGNIMAGRTGFGYLATDCGTGLMWSDNAREYPLSPWLNDPTATTGGETLELVTEDGRRSFFAGDGRPCQVIYGPGWSMWVQEDIRLTAFVPAGYKARIFLIEGGGQGQIAWHLPLAMAPDKMDRAFVITGHEDGCLTAIDPRSIHPQEVFRAAFSHELDGYTGDEASWLQGRYDGATGPGLQPCFGALWKADGLSVVACGLEDTQTMRKLADPARAAKELFTVRDKWRTSLSRVHIRTPDKDLDHLMNGWAAYQTMSCRLLGRTSLYQSGGAYGFRDQLQDAVNMILLSPDLAKEQILLCCSRQFQEGDVLHWWHEMPDGPKGVRTRCSDDLLWLAWALCEYTEKTGKRMLCKERVPWLEAPPLRETETDRYFTPAVSDDSSPVWEHAKRALDRVLSRGVGPHGLLHTGSGDWNDGMDKVGGESLWLTWFFIHVAERFSQLMTSLGLEGAERYSKAAEVLIQAAERSWDGRWYLRGWWEDGAPLGAAGASACAIDSIAQSWAAFCHGADDGRVRSALQACVDLLYDEAHGITKLFAPPFEDTGRDPGYIRACGPGFRENGGQYTHGAIWLASALLQKGMTEEGAKVLLDVMPARHDPDLWGAEPYVLAADVSANPDHYGEALWSWYTGASGWFFRVVLEDLLGIHLQDGHLTVRPRLPSGWEGYEAEVCGRKIRVRFGRTTIE